MKRIFKLILLLSVFCECNKNDEETIVDNANTEGMSEYKRAKDLIRQFSERIGKEKGGTRSDTLQIALSLAGKKAVVIPKTIARVGEVSTDSVNMFVFNTEKDGELGFAIATGKAEVGRVYAYVEDGMLLDTIENGGMAYPVGQIPDIIKQDQLNSSLTRGGE